MKRNKTLLPILLLITGIAAAEYLLMIVLETLRLSGTLENVTDSLSLVIVLSPLFYLLYRSHKALLE